MTDTKARSAKAKATRDAKAEARSKQTVTIGDWRICRFDEMNWKVLHKGKFHGYFGRMEAALLSLPEKMLTESEFTDVRFLLVTMHDTRKMVLDAVNEARKLSLMTQ